MTENFSFSARANLLKYSRWSFILGLALFPILMIPLPWFPFQLTKISVLCGLLLFSVATYALSSIHSRNLFVPRHVLLYGVIGYVAAVVVSVLISQNPAASLLGEAVETDTLLFTVLLALSFLMGAAHFKEPLNFRSLWSALLVSGLVVVLFQAVQLAFGPGLFGDSMMTTVSSSLVGRWNDLGIFMGFIAAIAMLGIDIGRVRGKMFVLSAGTFVMSLALLAIINIDAAWWVLLGAAVVCALSAYRNAPGAFVGMGLRRIPIASSIVAVLSVIFLIWGGIISPRFNEALAITEVEIRPSAQATIEVMRATYAQSTFTTLFGSGPSTFNEQWLLYKPAEVNLSQFWDVDFYTGFGTIPTMFITLGVVGGALLILLPFFVLFTLINLLRLTVVDPAVRGTASIAGIAAIALFALAFLYAAGQVILILAFTLLGVHAGLLSRSRSVVNFSPQSGFANSAAACLVLLVMIIAAAASLGIVGQRFLSTAYLGKALIAADGGTLDKAESYATRAISIRKSDDAYRFLASVKVARAQAVVANTTLTETQQSEAFQTTISEAIANAREAVAVAPREYSNWLALARIYEALIPLKVSGAYESAQQSYLEAIRRNPRNPGLYLAAARMEGSAGQEQSLRDAVSQALTLKPNYTDAVLLILQVEVAKKNLEGAIQASTAAIQTAPDNAGLWLQLGLLALNARSLTDAQTAFEQALTLLPDYANAKYFLGLTYYEQGKTVDAIRIFEDLARSNPDNAEVGLVLANMRAGKEPFAGANPPVENPVRPSNPPIKEQ